MKLYTLKFAKRLIYFGASIILLGLILLNLNREYFIDRPIDNELIGQIGDFIGGVSGSIWALAGVILFYVALHEQREDFTTNRKILSAQLDEFKLQQQELAETREVFKEQSATQRLQRFETSFFNMLSSLDDIVKPFNYIQKDPFKRSPDIKHEGRNLFAFIFGLVSKNFMGPKSDSPNFVEFEEIFKNRCAIIFRSHQIEIDLFTNMIEQLILLIFDSGLKDERQLYVNILKSQLTPFQLMILGYNLILKGEEKNSFLVALKELVFFKRDDFSSQSARRLDSATSVLLEKIGKA